MKDDVPAWAMRPAQAEDYGLVQDSHSRGTLRITSPDRATLRTWTKRQGWPAPWSGYEAAFLAKMLESPLNFTQAVHESGIELQIPRREYTLSAAALQELDAYYAERSPSGRPVSWGSLVDSADD